MWKSFEPLTSAQEAYLLDLKNDAGTPESAIEIIAAAMRYRNSISVRDRVYLSETAEQLLLQIDEVA